MDAPMLKPNKFPDDPRGVPRSLQCLPLSRLSPTSISYHHEVAGIPFSEASGESCSVPAKRHPLMNCIPLPKTAKLTQAKQLTQLHCLVIYVMLQFFVCYYKRNWRSALALDFTCSIATLGRGFKKSFNAQRYAVSPLCLVICLCIMTIK